MATISNQKQTQLDLFKDAVSVYDKLFMAEIQAVSREGHLVDGLVDLVRVEKHQYITLGISTKSGYKWLRTKADTSNLKINKKLPTKRVESDIWRLARECNISIFDKIQKELLPLGIKLPIKFIGF